MLYSETDLGCMEKNEQVMVEVDRWFGFLDENWWEESQRWSRVNGRINHARSLVLEFFMYTSREEEDEEHKRWRTAFCGRQRKTKRDDSRR